MITHRMAAREDILLCEACDLLSALPPAIAAPAIAPSTTARNHAAVGTCPRCAADLHFRKPDSIGRTWALLLSAFLLYIPANLLPIMETRSLFGVQDDTILSGVVFLWISGSWPLALLVFVASIVVPLFKLLALTSLTISVQRRSVLHPLQRTRLYRLIEVIGRWSMLDIYVVALLVALVQIKSFAAISAGPGAAAFGAVVVLTLAAAKSFDPRLIWDHVESDVGQ